MYVVHFYEEKLVVLSQLRSGYPEVGEDVKIKGRKGKVLSVNQEDERIIHISVLLEKATKNKFVEDPRKKKRR